MILDLVPGGPGPDTLPGTPLDDTIIGRGGPDSIDGSAGNDTLLGNTGSDRMDGGEGNDLLSGGAGNDTMTGGIGDDRIEDRAGRNVIDADAGNDTVLGGENYDLVHGGSGNDEIAGNGGRDLLFGDAGDDRIFGGAGDDRLFGGEGSDTMTATSGSDRLFGGEGSDTLIARDDAEGVFLHGGSDNDTLYAIGDIGGTLAGKSGFDVALLFIRPDGGPDLDVVLIPIFHDYRLSIDGTARITLTGIENLYVETEAGDDKITGTSTGDYINVRSGSNVVYGGLGADVIEYTVGAWNRLDADRSAGGADQLRVNTAAGDVLMFDASAPMATDNYGSFLLDFESYVVNGGDLGDSVIGGANRDYLNGGGGDDVIHGGGGRDTIHGNDGNDTISGTRGEDLLFGDAGADTFHFVSRGHAAHVMDFTSGTDRILIDAGTLGGDVPPPGPLDPARLSVGEATGSDGQFVLVDLGGGTIALTWDGDGDGAQARFRLFLLEGAPAITAADILIG